MRKDVWPLCTYKGTYNGTYTGTIRCTYRARVTGNYTHYRTHGVGFRDLLYPEMATNQVRRQPCSPASNLLPGGGGRV